MDTATESVCTRKPLVLSVDDEPNVLNALRRSLRRADVELLTANSGHEALALCAEHDFDVIISDMRMPEMNGAQFLAKASRIQPHSKRILLTGYADIDSTIDAINEGGISCYMRKPWDERQLLGLIDDAVTVRRLTARNKDLEALKSDLESALTRLAQSQSNMVALLGNAISVRDGLGREYSEQKLAIAEAMAVECGSSAPDIEDLRTAITLQRIGRLSLPSAIIEKPYLSMSQEERRRHDQHPMLAEGILMGVPELEQAAHLIHHQHERWDGSGLPDGLRAEKIPLGSQILAVIRDYFDMRAGLHDVVPMADDDAQAVIRGHVGTVYAPEIVEIFFQSLESLAEPTPERVLDHSELRAGMVLSRDLETDEGVLLLPKGHRLSRDLIKKIQRAFFTSTTRPVYVEQERAD
ncbi:MAG: HD domain-containing phosphohydrolase [Pseudomonadota bacterium]